MSSRLPSVLIEYQQFDDPWKRYGLTIIEDNSTEESHSNSSNLQNIELAET
ncbi:10027_t:CDS:1, partial [Ambispora leptoticha]